MSRIQQYIKRHWFLILASLIVVLASFLRFYDYENRWGLAYDQAYGALLARHALEEQKLPLLGPFSSAGPFQTGGEWYWFIMLGTILNPNSVVSPWVFLSFTSVFFVILMILVGSELINKKFGLIVGVLSAVSTSQIAQSFSLTNQSVIAIVASLAIWSSVRYIRERKVRYLFFLGLLTSLAATIHLQGAALIFLIFVTIIFTGIPKFKEIIALFLGLIIPTLPILIFDIKSNFINSKNMVQYYLYDQYKISFDVLGRRWLTYIFAFWPEAWAHIIGGSKIISWATIIILGTVAGFNVFKKKLSSEWYVILISFLLMVAYVRYLRTPLFDSYLIFLHPFIFILVGWMIWFLFKRNTIVASGLLLIVLACSIYKDIEQIKFAGNYSAKEAALRIKTLSEKFPNQKFSVYSYKYKWADKNLILSLYLSKDQKIDDNGRGIGVVVATRAAEFSYYPIISGGKLGYKLIDLASSTSGELSQAGWVRVNPRDIYDRTEEWYNP